jgi:(2R)-sulfolactate sulfo-lyase subunit alpha
MENSKHSIFLIRIHPSDNIMVIAKSVAAGSPYQVDGVEYTFELDLNLGHKVASQAISKGDKILKYGVSIGSALCDIKPGEHVHLHNIQSDYLPTYTLDEGSKFGN